jgi:putative tryptophan/tyrosine transport system substrate-binding protein
MPRSRFRILPALFVVLSVSACRSGDARPTVAIFNLLSHPILDESVEGIKEGLRAAGYDEQTLRIIDVNANGEMDKLDAYAREILQTDPDIIVPVSTPVAQAVIGAAPPTQRIVFSTVTNPSDIGVDAHPANVTGVSDAVNYAANLDLIHVLFPSARTLGVVYNPSERNSQFGVEQVRELVAERGLAIQVASVSRSDEVADAVRSLLGKIDVIYVGSDNTVVSALPAVVSVSAEGRVPVIASDAGSVEQGALAAVSVNYRQLGRRVGAIVAELLNSGGSPGSVPVEAFLGNSLLLNAKAAAATGYVFSDSLLQAAAVVVR